MDGTIVDTEPYWILAETELADSYGSLWTHEDGLSVVGQGLPHTASRLQQRGVALELEDIIEILTSRVLEQLEVSIPWRPGAPQLLASFQALGFKQALVTMSMERMARRVAELIPGKPMSVVVAGDNVSKSKPDPESYFLAAQLLGVDINRCVAFEDSPAGTQAAASSGAYAVGIPHLVPIPPLENLLLIDSLVGVDASEIIRLYTQDRKGT